MNDIMRYVIAVAIFAWGLWYILKPLSVAKGSQLERHLYKQPNRSRLLWSIRITGIVGVLLAIAIAFIDNIIAIVTGA